jgi:hypothetical protein
MHGEVYGYGSMCAPSPTAFAKDCDYIAKWRDILRGEYSRLDGVIISDGDYRTGNIFVVFFKPA